MRNVYFQAVSLIEAMHCNGSENRNGQNSKVLFQIQNQQITTTFWPRWVGGKKTYSEDYSMSETFWLQTILCGDNPIDLPLISLFLLSAQSIQLQCFGIDWLIPIDPPRRSVLEPHFGSFIDPSHILGAPLTRARVCSAAKQRICEQHLLQTFHPVSFKSSEGWLVYLENIISIGFQTLWNSFRVFQS